MLVLFMLLHIVKTFLLLNLLCLLKVLFKIFQNVSIKRPSLSKKWKNYSLNDQVL